MNQIKVTSIAQQCPTTIVMSSREWDQANVQRRRHLRPKDVQDPHQLAAQQDPERRQPDATRRRRESGATKRRRLQPTGVCQLEPLEQQNVVQRQRRRRTKVEAPCDQKASRTFADRVTTDVSQWRFLLNLLQLCPIFFSPGLLSCLSLELIQIVRGWVGIYYWVGSIVSACFKTFL